MTTTVLLGETVVLLCPFNNYRGTAQWTKDQFGLGDDRSLEAYDRYKMMGDDAEGKLLHESYHRQKHNQFEWLGSQILILSSAGNFSLLIKGATEDDEGAYECQLNLGDKCTPIKTATVQLRVLTPTPANLGKFSPENNVDRSPLGNLVTRPENPRTSITPAHYNTLKPMPKHLKTTAETPYSQNPSFSPI